MATKYRIKSMLFSKGFNLDTYNGLKSADLSVGDNAARLAGYERKYQNEIAAQLGSNPRNLPAVIPPSTANVPATIPKGQPPVKPAPGVGVWGGLKNTWKNAGFMKKAGIVGAGLTVGGLALKGASSMFGGNNNN